MLKTRQQPSRSCRIPVKSVATRNVTATQNLQVECRLCDWTGTQDGLMIHIGIKHKIDQLCPTCEKPLSEVGNKSNFNAHVKRCAAAKLRAVKSASAKPTAPKLLTNPNRMYSLDVGLMRRFM